MGLAAVTNLFSGQSRTNWRTAQSILRLTSLVQAQTYDSIMGLRLRLFNRLPPPAGPYPGTQCRRRRQSRNRRVTDRNPYNTRRDREYETRCLTGRSNEKDQSRRVRLPHL